jgi:predicted CXXCH cytochrome family protein
MRNVLDSRIRLFQGKIECVTCHDLTETADDLLVRFEAKYDLCTGCHRNAAIEHASPSFAERLNDR